MFGLSVPNVLTGSRFVLIIVFLIIFYLPFSWNYLVACIVFTVAALTDLFDGYYARKLGQVSELGRFLDPVADKILVTVVLIVLLVNDPSLYLAFPTLVIISREIIVSALREWSAISGTIMHVSIYGKMKTVWQMVALGFLIYHEPLFGLPIYEIGLILLYIATVFTLWSMFLYLRVFYTQLGGN